MTASTGPGYHGRRALEAAAARHAAARIRLLTRTAASGLRLLDSPGSGQRDQDQDQASWAWPADAAEGIVPEGVGYVMVDGSRIQSPVAEVRRIMAEHPNKCSVDTRGRVKV